MDSFDKGAKFLKSLELVEELNHSRPFSLMSSKFSQNFIEVSQKNDYLEVHKIAMENRDYDILLIDDAFLQFSCDISSDHTNWSIRYSYYESPLNILPYEKFLEEYDLDEEGYEEKIFEEEYEQYKMESQLKNNVTPIRYDYHASGYKELIHPISHIHIGLNNNVRIPINKIMLPTDFIVFVLQHVYIDKWKNEIKENQGFEQKVLSAKNTSRRVNDEFFTEKENQLYYLT